MAEGWARHLKGEVIEAYSAGTSPHGMNPDAVKVMAEAGVDISRQHSKHIDDLKGTHLDYVVTVCDNANESCPVLAGNVKRIHVGFDDPPRLAHSVPEADKLQIYRRVRDEIRAFIERLPQGLTECHA
jgi:arsenate reductase